MYSQMSIFPLRQGLGTKEDNFLRIKEKEKRANGRIKKQNTLYINISCLCNTP